MSGNEARRLAEAIEHLYSSLARQLELLGDGAWGDLPARQRLALATLVDAGELRLGALAQRLATTDPTASRTVESLVEAGLARRVTDPADRRAVLVSATAKGRRLLEQRRAQLVRLLERSLPELPGAADQRHIVEVLEELAAVLDVEAVPEPRRRESKRSP